MAAPKGNEYYKLRTKHGRDKIFETPEILIKECNDYFEFCLVTPLKEEVVHGKDSNIIELNKMRAFTLEGLCNFIDISVEGLKKYKDREDFVEVYTRVRQIIDSQQFEGAASGFLNPSIIAKKQGLIDKKEHDHKGSVSVSGFNYIAPENEADN